jgi:integrase
LTKRNVVRRRVSRGTKKIIQRGQAMLSEAISEAAGAEQKASAERKRRTPAVDPPKNLTAAAIKKFAANPAKKRRRIRDLGGQSLYLIIEPSGVKSFEMRFRRPGGRPAKIRLGQYDATDREIEGDPVIGQPLTLAAARALATKLHRERQLGRDVIGEHKAARHRQRAEVKYREASTFGLAVRDYLREYAQKQTRNWRETARLLGLHYDANSKAAQENKDGLAQRWGDKDVRSIDGHDVYSVCDEARRFGVPGVKARNKGLSEARGRALFVALSSLFKWLCKNRRVASNPCLNAYQPEPAKARDRHLTSDEIKWFWRACDEVDAPRVNGATKPFSPLLRLLLLTGSRLNEVARMTRQELGDDGMWRLPGSRTKNGKAHVVPLPPLAHELIASMPVNSDFVFSTNGQTPVSGWNRMKRRLDAAMLSIARKERGAAVKIDKWRLHDLRRTAITGMAELGIRPDVIELTVNHVSGSRGGIAGIYNRSELLPERQTALERWAAHVEGLVRGMAGSVVSLHPRQGGAA